MENTIKITKLQEQMKQVVEKIDSLDEKMDKGFSDIKAELSCFVRKEEFAPVKSIAYGLVGAILTGVITAVLYLIIK